MHPLHPLLGGALLTWISLASPSRASSEIPHTDECDQPCFACPQARRCPPRELRSLDKGVFEHPHGRR